MPEREADGNTPTGSPSLKTSRWQRARDALSRGLGLLATSLVGASLWGFFDGVLALSRNTWLGVFSSTQLLFQLAVLYLPLAFVFACAATLLAAWVRRVPTWNALARAARHLVIVVAAQSSAITHAYALIKRIAQDRIHGGFQIAITRARSHEEARAIFENMRRVAADHLGVRLDYLGDARVPVTEHLAEALRTLG